MIDRKEEERLLGDWGLPPSPTREINIDTHVGAAVQKPYAQIEHLLARKRPGFHSFEELKEAVDAAYPEGSQARKIEEDDGGIYRWVKGNTGRTVADANGVLQVEVYEERVPVALSQAGARAATQAGVRTDFFNGWTWVRGGEKLERDGNVLAQRPEANPNRRVAFEPADEASQMAYRAAAAAAVNRAGITPMPAPAAEAPKADSKKGKGD